MSALECLLAAPALNATLQLRPNSDFKGRVTYSAKLGALATATNSRHLDRFTTLSLHKTDDGRTITACGWVQPRAAETGPIVPPSTNFALVKLARRSSLPQATLSAQRTMRRTNGRESQRM